MIKTTNPFDEFLSSYEEDNVSIDYNDEVRSILVYIGLITVLLFFLLLIYSLINKCIKMLNDETITTTTKIKQQKRYHCNPLANRQTSMSSVSSSLFLLNSQSPKSSFLRMQHLPPIIHV